MIDNPSSVSDDKTEATVENDSSPAMDDVASTTEEVDPTGATEESAPPVEAEESAIDEASIDAESEPLVEVEETEAAGSEPAEEVPAETDLSSTEALAEAPGEDTGPSGDAETGTPVETESTAAEDESSPDDESAEPEVEDSKKWYVIKVQSGREETIKEAIERRVKIEGLEEYFGQILIPFDKETVKVKGQRKERKRKRYPGYIMAKVDYNDEILYLFRETSGVGDFVGGGLHHAPQPMSEREVEYMLGITDEIKPKQPGAMESSPFSLGDHVKIKDGVFSGMEGEVKEVFEEKGQIRVETMVIGRPVSVELEYWQVEEV